MGHLLRDATGKQSMYTHLYITGDAVGDASVDGRHW
jgi:hypothetical protein